MARARARTLGSSSDVPPPLAPAGLPSPLAPTGVLDGGGGRERPTNGRWRRRLRKGGGENGPPRLVRAIRTGLQEYCADPDEAALFRAYELGRGAAAAGFGVLDLVAVHQDVLIAALRNVRAVRESTLVVERAGELFAECAAPFETTRRVYQDRAAAVASSRKPRG